VLGFYGVAEPMMRKEQTMSKMFLGIMVLTVCLALMTSSDSFADTKEKVEQEVTTADPHDAATRGKPWGHGKRMDPNQRSKSHFDYLDTNKDGKVSYEEFIAPYKRRFEGADADKDGYLTKEEFGDAWGQMRRRPRDKRSRDDG
jgi:hypothetical protein